MTKCYNLSILTYIWTVHLQHFVLLSGLQNLQLIIWDYTPGKGKFSTPGLPSFNTSDAPSEQGREGDAEEGKEGEIGEW